MNKEEILSDFQACTGIEDLGLCLSHLELSDWNFSLAVGSALPEGSQLLTGEEAASSQRVTRSAGSASTASAAPVGEDSDVEDLTDNLDDDDFFSEGRIDRNNLHYLIPATITSELEGNLLFHEHFHAKYSNLQLPTFYTGTMEDALREATAKPASERSPLCIYLHHSDSVLANIWISQVLGTEGILNILNTNFVLWGWDTTLESSRNLVMNNINRLFGSRLVGRLRSTEKDKFPVLVVVSRVRGAIEVNDVILGSISSDELMSELLRSIKVHESSRVSERREEEERAERERVIAEQNSAYEESLKADMAKDEAKKAKARKEEREKEEKIKEEEAHRRRILTLLPPEPLVGGTLLRIRFPDGSSSSRRFPDTANLSNLFDFIFTRGFDIKAFKVLYSFPKKDVSRNNFINDFLLIISFSLNLYISFFNILLLILINFLLFSF